MGPKIIDASREVQFSAPSPQLADEFMNTDLYYCFIYFIL